MNTQHCQYNRATFRGTIVGVCAVCGGLLMLVRLPGNRQRLKHSDVADMTHPPVLLPGGAPDSDGLQPV